MKNCDHIWDNNYFSEVTISLSSNKILYNNNNLKVVKYKVLHYAS